MLSPGEDHKLVPKDHAENAKFRAWFFREGNTHKGIADLRTACSQDIFFWINTFVYQYNPNTIGPGSLEIGPFITWDFQEEAVRAILYCIEERKDLVIEKSREMGASWLCLLIMDWFLLFHPWKKFLVISRNEEAVDRPGDPDCLFWKLDFVHDRLPKWMTEGLTRRKHNFENKNGSTITGQASTGKAGVGGRAFCMFLDEFSQVREDYEVLHRTSDTTGCRIFNGTHLGLDTAFYELTTRVDMKKLRLHWTQHPDKVKGLYQYDEDAKLVRVKDQTYNYPDDFTFVLDGKVRSPWYDKQCRRKGSPRAIAMDLDINPQGSVSQFVDPTIIRRLVETDCCDPYWEGRVQYDMETAQCYPEALVKEPGGLVRLWVLPNGYALPKLPYAAGVDVSEGTGTTPSCLSVFNCRTGEKVLELVDRNTRPEEFAVVVVSLCRLFQDENEEPAKLVWEQQGPGDRFGKKVLELGYRNIYYKENEIVASWVKKQADIPGWFPSPQNKTRLLGDYRSALYSRACINRSRYALEQFLKFRYSIQGYAEWGGKATDDYSGIGVNHGDIVISDALAWKLTAGFALGKKKTQVEEIKVGSLAWRRQRRKERELA